MVGLRTFYMLLAVCAFSVDPDEHATRKRPPLFTISPETTVIDGPLTQHGTIDYIAYLNQRYSEGVTADNNAVVLLCEAFGPEIVYDWDREVVFSLLKLPPPPEDGEYFVTLEEFARQSYGDDADSVIEQMQADSAIARNMSWTSEEFPELDALLDANERPLEVVARASHRSRFYMPFTCSLGNFLFFVGEPAPRLVMEASRLLALRSTRHLGEGNIDDAWADLMCILRLAKLVDDSGAPLCELTSMAAFGVAFQNLQAMLCSNLLDEARAERFLREYAHWKPLQSASESWVEMSRLTELNSLQEYAAGNLSMREILVEKPVHGTEYESQLRAQTPLGKRAEFMIRVFANLHTDWNAAARRVVYFYDRCHEAFATETYRDRVLAFGDLEKEFEQIAPHYSPSYYPAKELWYRLQRFIVLQRTPLLRGNDVAGLMVRPANLPVTTYVTGQARYEAKQRLATIGLALAAYRARHEEYPAELSELVPDYVAEVPLDPYTDAPFVYQLNGTGYILYALGPNLVDDGGIDVSENDFDIILRVDHAP